MICKIISRILVKKLRDILSSHVSPSQTTFPLGRWIVENTLISQEVLFTISKKNSRKGGLMEIIGFKKSL